MTDRDQMPPDAHPRLRVLVVTQGLWGERIADNVGQPDPFPWTVHHHRLPRVLPPVIDDADEFLPEDLPQVDLLLALGETPGAAQLIPDLVDRTRARAVIAPIDRNESLPPGLAAQLARALDERGVRAAFPKPFCSLTPDRYNQPPIAVPIDDPLLRAFANRFGSAVFTLTVDGERRIRTVVLERDAPCGCARSVAEGLVGTPVEEAVARAGLLHHHYPCLASMNQDPDYGDTLMHVSGHILRQAVQEKVREDLEPVPYWRPAGRVDPEHFNTT